MKKLLIVLLIIFHMNHSKEQQLCMFIHQDNMLTDDEGMNVAHQFLTLLVQKACPLLISQTLWDHVVKRKNRFDNLTNVQSSLQSEVVRLHQITNTMIQQYNGNVHILNKLLNQLWFAQNFKQLASLNHEALNILFFDYFCSKLEAQLESWNVYCLPEGYILCIPKKDKEYHFCLDQLKSLYYRDMQHINRTEKKQSISKLLQKYLCVEDVVWSFYLTGHGHHKDEEHGHACIAGMDMQDFQNFLLTLNSRLIKTKVLVYSSCYSAGEHSVLPYRFADKDMLLKYPVIMISCMDAPTYVFGVPAGLRLPPYHKDNILTKQDVLSKQLHWHLMQNFHEFVAQTKKGQFERTLAHAVSPYVHCEEDICNATKIENLPLIRKAGQLHFMPLDESLVSMIQQQSKKYINVGNTSAVMLYVKKYLGIISITSKLPTFVSMVPGNQVHCISKLEAKNHTFTELITSCFMTVEDEHEQNIYLFDTIRCKVDITSDKQQSELYNVVIIPSGPWMPQFVDKDAELYVYAQQGDNSYWISFAHGKPTTKIILNAEQVIIMKKFISLLKQQCSFGDNFSMKQLLSADHFMNRVKLHDQLLQECLQDLICKHV